MQLASDDADAVEEARAMMERQLGQMVRLIDDLLDISRITRGKIELRKERVELVQIIRQAIETSRPHIETRGHLLTVDLPTRPIFVHADATRLAQVFSNLLNNAAKFTDHGGRITLAVERQESEAVISVRDSGIGIPTEMLSKVFEMFTQVDQSIEKTHGGLGIGLSLVKGIVELHGGSVVARSKGRGTGSELVVHLPVMASPAAAQPVRRSGTEPSATAGRRILVVDDNQDAAFTIAMMLRLMGSETHTAHDGLTAVEMAETFRPDLILLDIGMPKLNGYDAARRIRQQSWGKEIRLVALTGWGQERDKRYSLEAGFDGHLVKPVGRDALLELLAALPSERSE
jgi:CheY-like chemotaxis protein